MILEPSQFQVNEAWIAFRLNDSPVSTEADGDFHVLALMDAASLFILDLEFVHTSALELSPTESKGLLERGWSHRKQFPKKLIIPHSQSADTLSTEAESHGIAVVRVPEKELLVFIDEARQSFQEHVSGGRIQ